VLLSVVSVANSSPWLFSVVVLVDVVAFVSVN
jgi:hypothetical protein